MFLVKQNFHAHKISKIAGEFLSAEELTELGDIKSKLLEQELLEDFKGQEGDESHLGLLSCDQLRALILKKDKLAKCGKSIEGLKSFYRSMLPKEELKEAKRKKKKKKKKKKATK